MKVAKKSYKKKVGIMGQGFVGLPLALHCLRNGYEVCGFEIDENVIAKIESNNFSSPEVDKNELSYFRTEGAYKVSSSPKILNDVEVIVICVPTPLNLDNSPNLEFLEAAVKIINQNAKKGTLIINESTSYPGTLRNIVANQLSNFNLEVEELYLAVAPERINPGDGTQFSQIPRVVGGLSIKAVESAESFYRSLGCDIFKASTPEVAEMSKLIENSFRQISISFINDLQELAFRSGINLRESISAASTKPYGFMPFYPSAGIGGHCIPVDPLYLNYFAEQYSMSLNLIRESSSINDDMGNRIVNRVEKKLSSSVHGLRVLLLGITYKPNIADVRETPATKIFEELIARGAEVFWHDTLVEVWRNQESSSISGYDWDVSILIYPSENLNIDLLCSNSKIVLDTSGKFLSDSRIFQI